ncbi:MAG TPA: aldehyde dehydrogenase family protein [Solirubrobacterales bacterium]|nr:aldehyde dehydrogenase family protein [Solirubrobacterales bacterium]
MSEFVNEPLLELRRPEVRERLTDALAELDLELPLEVPVLIDGEARARADFDSVDPARPERVVARAAAASAEEVREAVEAVGAARRAWEDRPASERAEVLLKAAVRLRSQRERLAALTVREAGKPWPDADAEVAEAIDFVEYYARGAVRLDEGRELIEPPGEHNRLRYAPRGVVAVIAPWNFPLAISTGMVVAGLATGNGVAYKPAEQTPGCALALVEALLAAGMPAGALALLPGGDDPGIALVASPGVHTIAFTGSCAAGLAISRAAAEPAPGQGHMKRVIAEMGGKNCVIVDADADLDEVVPDVVRSAFAFAGQKCSAAARLLVHERIADGLASRLRGAIESLLVGPPDEFGTDVGPLIDGESVARYDRYLELARAEGSVEALGPSVPDRGYYRPPALVAGLPADSAVVNEEIFAPLLTFESIRSVEDGFARVEASQFALTGGLFTRNPDVVAEAERRLPVGNLYVNRAITGAVVGRQPFGGNRLSGTGSKAGGPDYLLGFVEPRVVSENKTRHGLVV